ITYSRTKFSKMAQPVNSDTQLIPLPGQSRGQAVPFSRLIKNKPTNAVGSTALIPLKTSIIKSPKTFTKTSTETSYETSAENSAETSSETFIDPRPRTIIFTSNPQINASIEDRLTSYDQTEIFKYRPVDIIIIGAFNRTQIQNRPLYLNALLIQSRGIDAKTVSNVLKKGLQVY